MRLIPFCLFRVTGLVTPELHLTIRRMALHQYWIDVQEEGIQKCKLQDAKDSEKLQLITHSHLFHLFVIELKHKQLLPI